MMEEYEYFVKTISDNLWIIYKVDHHGKEPSNKYTVLKSRQYYHCDCPASAHCKHIDMVKELTDPKPRKELF